jgi:hypothetical protein
MLNALGGVSATRVEESSDVHQISTSCLAPSPVVIESHKQAKSTTDDLDAFHVSLVQLKHPTARPTYLTVFARTSCNYFYLNPTINAP